MEDVAATIVSFFSVYLSTKYIILIDH